MTYKRFYFVKLLAAMVVGIFAGHAAITENYLLLAVVVVLAAAFLATMRYRMTEVIADERDYGIAGKAARITVFVFATISTLAAFSLLALRDYGAEFELVGFVLAYAACGLLFIYRIIYSYLERGTTPQKKLSYVVVALMLAAVLAIAGVRLFSGEDSWLCQNGQWIKHGNPSAPMPETGCEPSAGYVDDQTISWFEAEQLLADCRIKQVGQTHALAVTLTLDDGIRLQTTEQVIDYVLRLASEAQQKSGSQIIMATE